MDLEMARAKKRHKDCLKTVFENLEEIIELEEPKFTPQPTEVLRDPKGGRWKRPKDICGR
jgi:hypothetical protein